MADTEPLDTSRAGNTSQQVVAVISDDDDRPLASAPPGSARADAIVIDDSSTDGPPVPDLADILARWTDTSETEMPQAGPSRIGPTMVTSPRKREMSSTKRSRSNPDRAPAKSTFNPFKSTPTSRTSIDLTVDSSSDEAVTPVRPPPKRRTSSPRKASTSRMNYIDDLYPPSTNEADELSEPDPPARSRAAGRSESEAPPGSWLNPAPARLPAHLTKDTDSSTEPPARELKPDPEPDGSWLHPVPMKINLKRRVSPLSGEDSTDTRQPVPNRRGKIRRVDSPPFAPSVEIPQQAEAIMPAARPGPKWNTASSPVASLATTPALDELEVTEAEKSASPPLFPPDEDRFPELFGATGRESAARSSASTDDPLLLRSEDSSIRGDEIPVPSVGEEDAAETNNIGEVKALAESQGIGVSLLDATDKEVEEAVEQARLGVDDVAIERTSSSAEIEPVKIPEFRGFSAMSGGLSRLEYLRLRQQASSLELPSTPPQPTASDEQPDDTTIVAEPPPSIVSGVEVIDMTLDSPSPPSNETPAEPVDPGMTREEWRAIVISHLSDSEVAAADDVIEAENPVSESTSASAVTVDGVEYTLTDTFTLPAPKPTPPERSGKVRRHFDSRALDNWHRLQPSLTRNPQLHSAIFEAYVAMGEGEAGGIPVVNTEDDGAPPSFEFEYSGEMMYHEDVPDPELGQGCGCDGPCDENNMRCACVRRQRAYFYGLGMTGFAYDRDGRIKENSVSVWECGETCGCPPNCMNRVIQRGRSRNTSLELFKTKLKGWGIRAKTPIPSGTFIGTYAGELITEAETERRAAQVYTQIGRNYLFDCDGFQIGNPPKGLAWIDPRLAELAAESKHKADLVREYDDSERPYSAYSVDAFHFGNFTRYFNHSCDPNLVIVQAYVRDFHPERPSLHIFTRRDVEINEELCISYKGIMDSEEIENIRAAKAQTRSIKIKIKKPKGGWRHKRSKGRIMKTSSSGAVQEVKMKGSQAGNWVEPCQCGADICNGIMFNI